jgi:acetyl-CoA acyltransferase
MNDAFIVSAVRTPVGKAPRGALRYTRPDEMAALVIREALARVRPLDPAEVEDVILGCAMPEGEQGLNVARIASLRAGVPISASAVTVNRFCSSGLQAIAYAAERIMTGGAQTVVAGGTESMSMVPMGGNKIAPNPALVDSYPDVYLTTGLVAENHVRDYGLSRDEQDAFALRSHSLAVAAIDAGRFAEEIVPVHLGARALFAIPAVAAAAPLPPNRLRSSSAEDGQIGVRPQSDLGPGSQSDLGPGSDPEFRVDEGPRRETSAEALAKLRPAFHVSGTVTAGNSSPMSDGAAAVVVMSGQRVRELGLTPLARFVGFATAGVEPERFGIGPVPAVRKLLKQSGRSLDDMDLIELNEAFAAQVLACLRELPIDPDRLNVNGGAIALGHPLGCTGAKLTATLLFEMRRRHARYGLVTMCVGGGMGAAGIFEAC